MGTNKEIVLIDLSAIYYRAALSQGPDTVISQAASMTIDSINKIKGLFDPNDSRIVICCDSPKSWRKKLDPTYKANRERQADGFFVELNKTKDRLAKDGYQVLESDGYEADDVIASVCKAADPVYYDVYICSPDKDLLQLVGFNVKQLRTHEMFLPDGTTPKVWDEALTLDVFGVPPHKLADWLAIVGDKTDNVDGIEGVGGKGGAALLSEFGSLTRIFEAVDALKDSPGASPFIQKSIKRWKTSLDQFFLINGQENSDRLARNRILTGLKSDIPIDMESIINPAVAKSISTDGWEQGATAGAPEVESTIEDRSDDCKQEAKSETQSDTSIVKVDPLSQFDADLQPTGMAGAWWAAQRAVSSRLYDKFGSVERGLMAINRGKDFGLSWSASLELLNVIKNKICPPAQVLAAMANRNPDCLYFYVKDVSKTSATAVTRKRGKYGTEMPEQTFTYTIEMAQDAGLVKPDSGYVRNPAAQLVARAQSWLARWAYPESTCGAYSFEEMEGEK